MLNITSQALLTQRRKLLIRLSNSRFFVIALYSSFRRYYTALEGDITTYEESRND